MRIALTGATGFIGSHVARQLVGEGHDVYALVRGQPGNLWRIEDIVPSLRIRWGDAFDATQVDTWIEEARPEVCVHLAWFATPGKYLSSAENLRCITGSIHLAERLAVSGCRRLVVSGSCFEYDLALGYLSENTPTRPASMYAAAKLGLELLLEHWAPLAGIACAWVRFFYQYGPYEDERRLVPAVVLPLLRGDVAKVTAGAQIRDFLHVADVASAVCAVTSSEVQGVVNIGSGVPIRLREMVAAIAEVCGRADSVEYGAIPYRPGDAPFVCADNRRLIRETAWQPRFDLAAGIEDTVSWWRANVGRSQP